MKGLILAAGYATRLYPLTKDKAKPLLPVGNRPVIGHILEKLERIAGLTEVVVVTNHKFHAQFREWIETQPFPVPLSVVDDGSQSEEDRLGAVGDILFVIRQRRLREDLLVVGGDNLFDFGLDSFVSFARTKSPFPSVLLYDVGDLDLARHYGIAALDADGRVARLEEKPDAPTSTLASMCVYYFPEKTLSFFEEYERLSHSKDAPGHYIRWLQEKKGIYGNVAQGMWYDIGDLTSYQKACETFEKGGKS